MPALQVILQVLRNYLLHKLSEGKFQQLVFGVVAFVVFLFAIPVLTTTFLLSQLDENINESQLYQKVSNDIFQSHLVRISWIEVMAIDSQRIKKPVNISESFVRSSFLVFIKEKDIQAEPWMSYVPHEAVLATNPQRTELHSLNDVIQFHQDSGNFGITPEEKQKAKEKILQNISLLQLNSSVFVANRSDWIPNTTLLAWPLSPEYFTITSPYGMRLHPIQRTVMMHEGIDVAANYGAPIFAIADGVVSDTSVSGIAGKTIMIQHDFNQSSRYAHLSVVLVKKGDAVTKGQIIGEVGSSGQSTGPHLHFEFYEKGKTVDPIQYY